MRWSRVVWMLVLSLPAQAEELTLRVMARASQTQAYFHQLLVAAMAQAGTTVHLKEAPDMPNARVELLLAQGQLDVHWFLRTASRDQRFLRVDQGLTDGMIGWRILMVPPGEAASYARLRTLADLKRSGKVAAMGHGWADACIWQQNGLPAIQQRLPIADLYRLVANGNRGMHYFPRGSIEVGLEQPHHAGLVAAPGVVLVYPQDFYFYLPTAKPELRARLQHALQLAEQSGLRQRLFRQHYGAALAELALDKRVPIRLALRPGKD